MKLDVDVKEATTTKKVGRCICKCSRLQVRRRGRPAKQTGRLYRSGASKMHGAKQMLMY
jgi:hypothetical protein